MRTTAFLLSLIMILMIPWANFISLPGLGTASRAMGIFVGAFWLFTIVVTGRIRKIGPFHVFVFLFFLWNAVSVLWSIDPGRSLTQIFTYVQMAILSLMLWDLYTTSTALRAGLQAYVLGLTVPIVSTVANFIASTNTEYALYGRYSASGNNTNTTAIILAIGLPLAWYLAASAGEGKTAQVLRLVNYAYIPAITFAIILTGTRFALIMSLPAFLFGLGTLKKLKPVSRILIFVLLVAAVIVLGSIIPEAIFERLGTIDDELQGGDLNDRTELWQIGLDLWLEHPVLGLGSAGYNKAVEPIYGRPRAVHNSFIAVLAELGIIGFGLFGIVLFTAVFLAWRHQGTLNAWFWLTVLATWGIGNLALTWTYSKPTWLLLTLLAVSASLPRLSGAFGPRMEPSSGYTTTTRQPPTLATRALQPTTDQGLSEI